MEYEAVIGLEIHAQLKTRTKIFCGCANTFGEPPNTKVCPVCLGMPGVLPVLNEKALELAIKTALALNCEIPKSSKFDRKNYFYPDLPKGYQISQFDQPLAIGGNLQIETDDGPRNIRLNRIHMEEDAGKLIHAGQYSQVDLNRAGVPLIEIVTEPEIKTPEEARKFLIALKAILEYIDACDGNMEQGSLRCDANISIRPKGETTLGVKAEVKNLNSFRNVQAALEYEIKRQIQDVKEGKKIVQETRLFDANKNRTQSMRSKEEAHDYRYFPEPDLVPTIVEPTWLSELREGLPELPRERKQRFVSEYGIPSYDATILTNTKAMANYFEDCVLLHNDPKIISNWIMSELLRELNNANQDIRDCLITPVHLTGMLKLMEQGTISGKIAKTVFEEMFGSGKKPEVIVEEKGLVQITDSSAISALVDKVIAANEKVANEFRDGKDKALGFLVGQIMKESRGKANPKMVNELLIKKLRG